MKEKHSSDEEETENLEWASAMENVLNMDKPKSKSSLILSRAVKLDPKQEESSEDEDNHKQLLARANARKEWLSRGRYKPNPSEEGERERKLRRIAVAGVVQLFNAVGKHQQSQSSSVAKIPATPSKPFKPLDKKAFLGLLLGKDVKSEYSDTKDEPEEIKEEEEDVKDEEPISEKDNDAPKWDVLRNDFMMSTKLKDWDKQLES